jgi:GTP cyclohydrolase II/3,4-dihydroxy 2-butanone 4-phosphate synthase/GTP cyclohydrolase II
MRVDDIETALEAMRAGRPVVVLDDHDRENEGDLIMAAEFADEESVAFLLEHTSGLLCTAITAERAAELELPLMVTDNTESHGTAFLVSVDYRHETSTGISAADRAATMRALAARETRPEDLARPGHVLPLLARPGGVLERPGHTEAGVDLCELAGLTPAAVLCEIVTPDRRGMMRGTDLVQFAAAHGLPVITIADLIAYRRCMPDTDRSGGAPPMVRRASETVIPVDGVDFRAVCYSTPDGQEHLAFALGDLGDLGDGANVLVRVHSECLTGDVFGSQRCDCGDQLTSALRAVTAAGQGVLVYLRGHEGRGIGLAQKIRAYELQQRLGLDTVDANLRLGLPVDDRDYAVGAHILADLGVRRVRLITNNPDKVAALEEHGLTVVERVRMDTRTNPHNVSYLRTKRERMGHSIGVPTLRAGQAERILNVDAG